MPHTIRKLQKLLRWNKLGQEQCISSYEEYQKQQQAEQDAMHAKHKKDIAALELHISHVQQIIPHEIELLNRQKESAVSDMTKSIQVAQEYSNKPEQLSTYKEKTRLVMACSDRAALLTWSGVFCEMTQRLAAWPNLLRAIADYRKLLTMYNNTPGYQCILPEATAKLEQAITTEQELRSVVLSAITLLHDCYVAGQTAADQYWSLYQNDANDEHVHMYYACIYRELVNHKFHFDINLHVMPWPLLISCGGDGAQAAHELQSAGLKLPPYNNNKT